MHPIVTLTVDGTPVAGTFYERLVSLTITDHEGVQADTFEAELNDGPPQFLALPRRGAIVVPSLGYQETGQRRFGRFTVDQVNGKCLPYSLSISGKQADLKSGKLKSPKERHWDGKTIGDIVKEIAGETGLEARVSQDMAGKTLDWAGQQDESAIHFLERLARRHGALFAVKDGKLLFVARGAGQSASGSDLDTLVITPAMLVKNSMSFDYNDRGAYKKVVAYYQDRDKAERREVEVDGDSNGDGIYRIPEPFSSPDEADEAASSKAKKLKSGEGRVSFSTPGDVTIFAGRPVVFSDVRPGVDGVDYVIETATHTYSKRAGYVTKVDAKKATSGKKDDD
jgi:phage protein D